MTSAAPTGKTRTLKRGDRIGGKLKLLRSLAEGGMGSVWVARNMATEADVAIKVLRSGREDERADAAERFRHEAKLGATLAHRNITCVFDLLEDDDGSLVLIMELLRGETLQDYLKSKGALSTKEAVAIIVPILSALQHAHDHGVVHRDVKPANIFLHVDPDGHVIPKLLDFGIAKVRAASLQTLHGSVLGTPRYMSPEQVRVSKELDGRSDLFSVGVVLYELITGENPFSAPSASASLAQVLEVEIDPDPRIDARVWLEMRRALSKHVHERHASASVLGKALCSAIGESETALAASLHREKPIRERDEGHDEPTSAGSAHTLDQTGAPAKSRRRPQTLLMLGVAVVLVLGGGGVLLSRAVTNSKPSPLEPLPPVVVSPGSTKEIPRGATLVPSGEVPASQAGQRTPDIELDPPLGTAKTPASSIRPRVPPSPPKPHASSTVKPVARTPGF